MSLPPDKIPNSSVLDLSFLQKACFSLLEYGVMEYWSDGVMDYLLPYPALLSFTIR
jgi:hypothetical protein